MMLVRIPQPLTKAEVAMLKEYKEYLNERHSSLIEEIKDIESRGDGWVMKYMGLYTEIFGLECEIREIDRLLAGR